MYIYSFSGKLEKTVKGAGRQITINSLSGNGVYLIKTVTKSGKIFDSKVIIN
ncbi:MAG: T9SS type A sorting domain-containing protein [Prevotellaceae bacterium]|nr:T9SS type A sorting domain-containing protein [Prevotellaceae bacterium]